ncbi:putative transcriptional regulator [Tranquillimonas rosea]|uniref:UPF0301 protein SAMN04490244_102116 n=1 Tax=Tranquillimonas rosea TaxID=641238 RepID=A0A1H9R663_9RHOB|nr:YqgE/AlgH family protein [Tranquillimonas rosea]SER67433.1 putative transcriptional regulator [Tranquillimonas rosea]
MSDDPANEDLSGKLLIAMPGMGDPRFDRSVIFLCAHSEDGAMGLIVNKPSSGVTFAELLEQLSIDPGMSPREIRVYFGGPVDTGRGFVLHSADYGTNSSTLHVDDSFGMTATLDVLEDISEGRGPDNAILALGYAGWGPGQLEDEIRGNGWLTADASGEIVFDGNDEAKWSAALRTLGIDPVLLSSTAGRA